MSLSCKFTGKPFFDTIFFGVLFQCVYGVTLELMTSPSVCISTPLGLKEVKNFAMSDKSRIERILAFFGIQ